MRRSFSLPWIGLAVALLVIPGCSKGPSEAELRQAELDTQLEQLDQSYSSLLQLRADLEAARAERAEIEEVQENRRTDEQKARLAELEESVPQLDESREAAFDQVQVQLADFLNVALNEVPDTESTRRALEIYSTEAVLVAEDMIVKAGDYKKAIDHLSTAQGYYAATSFDPNPELVAAIERYKEMRYINQERFDAVTKGMTTDEVRETAGVPYYGNIRTDDKQGVEMWLYPKREGGAAAVYFKTKSGKVYDKKFDAVKTKVVDS